VRGLSFSLSCGIFSPGLGLRRRIYRMPLRSGYVRYGVWEGQAVDFCFLFDVRFLIVPCFIYPTFFYVLLLVLGCGFHAYLVQRIRFIVVSSSADVVSGPEAQYLRVRQCTFVPVMS
jgi:hypothetical protein